MRILFYLTILLIAYGSLYPFDFQSSVGTLSISDFFLLGKGTSNPTLSNLLANVALFIPYGLFGILSGQQNQTNYIRIISIITWGILLAYALQILQLYLPSRYSDWFDVVWNTLGIGIGMLVANIPGKWLGFIDRHLGNWRSLEGFLILGWLAAELVPFVPTLEVDLIRDNVKTLINPEINFLSSITQSIYWLTFAYLLRLLTGIYRAHLIFAFILSATLLTKLFLVNNTLTTSDLLAGLLGYGASFFVFGLARYQQRNLITFLLIGAIAATGLYPFEINPNSNSFNWVPFHGLLTGNMLHNTQVLFEKLFIYGSLLYLLREAGSKLLAATAATAIFALFIEVFQLFLDSHTAEISDPLLVVIAAVLIHLFTTHKPGNDSYHSNTEVKISEIPGVCEETSSNGPGIKKPIGLFLVSAVVVSILIALALKIPRIPYNLREMFLFDGSILSIFLFSVALLWIGLSARKCSLLYDNGNHLFLTLPGCTFVAGAVGLILLSISVTQESIADIVGSSNLYWFVTNKRIWGEAGYHFFQVLPVGAVSAIERVVRYLALFSPVLFTIIIANILLDQSRTGIGKLPKTFLHLTAIFLPWFFLCKFVAFDHSSTDGLNELIARPGEYGIGGGGYLYLLLFLISLNAAWVSRTRKSSQILIALVVSILLVPLGWYLLNNGLVGDFKKYKQIFSGIDFLLGPNRYNHLPDAELYLRWGVVQIGLVSVLALGQVVSSIATGFRQRPATAESKE